MFPVAQDKDGGEGGIRTPVPITRQDAFEAPPLRPLRYLSKFGARGYRRSLKLTTLRSHFAARSAPFAVWRSQCAARLTALR
jgi:hypothetical protein